MRRNHFFTQREKLGFVQASILFQLYMNVYYMGIFILLANGTFVIAIGRDHVIA